MCFVIAQVRSLFVRGAMIFDLMILRSVRAKDAIVTNSGRTH